MPRLTKAVPKYRKHRASGQAIVSLNGKDHYFGPHRTKVSRLEYDRLIAERLAGGRRLSPALDATLPHLSDVIADMVRQQRAAGMRPGEVVLIRPCDIDRSGNAVRAFQGVCGIRSRISRVGR